MLRLRNACDVGTHLRRRKAGIAFALAFASAPLPFALRGHVISSAATMPECRRSQPSAVAQALETAMAFSTRLGVPATRSAKAMSGHACAPQPSRMLLRG